MIAQNQSAGAGDLSIAQETINTISCIARPLGVMAHLQPRLEVSLSAGFVPDDLYIQFSSCAKGKMSFYHAVVKKPQNNRLLFEKS